MIGTDLNLDLPSLSDTLSTIVSKLVTALSSVEDSIADQATPAALNINTNLSFGGYHATNLGGIILATGTAPTSAGSMYYSGGSFYLKDATGTIQLTANGAINLSAIGAIGGDYGSGAESLNYDLASQQYRLMADATTWADVVVDDVLLMEPTGANFVRLAAPSLTADYTVTFPSAVPSVTSNLQMDSSGNLTARSTSHQLVIPASAGFYVNGDVTWELKSGRYQESLATGGADPELILPVPLPVGAVITGYTVYINKTAATATHSSISGVSGSGAAGTGGSGDSTSATTGYMTLSETGLSLSVTADLSYTLHILMEDPIAGDKVYHAVVDYTFA